jgi:Na+/phosphate symporter
MGLTEMGFVSLRAAYFAMLGASAGTTVWLWLVLSGWHLGPLLLATGAFGLILAQNEHWEELMSAILSIGLALMGLELLFAGVGELFGDIVSAKVGASTGSVGLGEQLSFVLLGAVLGLILQSTSAALVLLMGAVPVMSLTLATGTSLFLGANLGLTTTAVILSRSTRAATRQLSWAYLITKGIGVTGAMLFFPTFLALVERIVLIFTNQPNLLTKLVVAQVLFNLINSLIFGILADPILRVLAHFIPEQEMRNLGLAKRVRRMLFQDPKLASREMDQQLRNLELEVKANYDHVMQRLTSTDTKEAFKSRAQRERNFRSLKFTVHDLLFSIDRHQEGNNEAGTVLISLLEYYGALTRTLFHLEDHYEKGLSKKFRLPPVMEDNVARFKILLDELWYETLLERAVEDEETEDHSGNDQTLEEIVLDISKGLGVEYQGYATWLMETAGFLRLVGSDLGQLVQRRSQLRSFTEE